MFLGPWNQRWLVGLDYDADLGQSLISAECHIPGVVCQAHPSFAAQRHQMRAVLTVEKWIAVTLWKLATSDCYQLGTTCLLLENLWWGLSSFRCTRPVLLHRIVTMGNVTGNNRWIQCSGLLKLCHPYFSTAAGYCLQSWVVVHIHVCVEGGHKLLQTQGVAVK